MQINKKKILALVFSLMILATPMIALGQFKPEDYSDDAETAGLVGQMDLRVVIYNVVKWLLGIMVVVSVAMFVVAGILFIVGGANSKMSEVARKMITYAIIGLIVGLLGYVVVVTINALLKGGEVGTV